MEKFSIIIPVYNSEKYLRMCLDSVTRVEYPINVILIDDGSTDSSYIICDEYVKKDCRFKVIHQQNAGLVKAREVGIANVESKYFTFIDSDDYIDSTEFSKLLEKVEQELFEVDVICYGLIEEYHDKKVKKNNKLDVGSYVGTDINKIHEKMLSFGEFFEFGILPNAVCKIYNTEFVRRNPCRINPNITIGEDADMTFQLLLNAKRVSVLNATPYHYLRRDDSMMGEEINSQAIFDLEKDLRTAFELNGNSKLVEQLNDYMDFIKMICVPELLLNNIEFFKSQNERIALYGAGGAGKAIKRNMKNKFTMWVDQNYKYYNCKDILPVEKLLEEYYKYDKIFIAISSIKTCEQIKSNLLKMGIKKPIYYYRMPME